MGKRRVVPVVPHVWQHRLALFTVTTGESHGPALGAVVDRCPPGLETGRGRFTTSIWTGAGPPEPAYHPAPRTGPGACILVRRVRGRTTGTPIGLADENVDQRSSDYGEIMDRFRPGHADFTHHQQIWHPGYRGGGRSRRGKPRCWWRRARSPQISARALRGEHSRLSGSSLARPSGQAGRSRDNNPFFCGPRPRPELNGSWITLQIRRLSARKGRWWPAGAGGLGASRCSDRLDADIAHALMSINAVKGWRLAPVSPAEQRGTEHRDELTLRVSQQPCRRRVGRIWRAGGRRQHRLKPTSSHLRLPGRTVDIRGESGGGSDPGSSRSPVSAFAPRPSPRRCWRWC